MSSLSEGAGEEVAFDLGLIRFVGHELRHPWRTDAEALEQITLRLGHFAVEAAGPGGGEIVLDNAPGTRPDGRLADSGR